MQKMDEVFLVCANCKESFHTLRYHFENYIKEDDNGDNRIFCCETCLIDFNKKLND